MSYTTQTKKSVTLHPYFMIRMAGLSVSVLNHLSAPNTGKIIYEIDKLKNWNSQSKQNICESIESYVQKTDNNEIRKKLINYKRNIYNDRMPKHLIKEYQEYIPQELYQYILSWEKNQREIEQLQMKALTSYENECIAARQFLHQSINHDNFLNGIVFSSRDMWKKVSKYISTPLEDHNSRLKKVETSLLQFVSRVAGKTSPLSTFTPISIGKWNNSIPYNQLMIDGDIPKSVIEINHAIIDRIVQGLLQRSDSRQSISYKLNPSITVIGNKLHLIKRSDDSKLRPKVFNTIEQPITLDFNGAIQFVFHIYDEHHNDAINYKDLRQRFSSKTNQEISTVDLFLGKLLELQIIIPNIEIFEQTDQKIIDSIEIMEQIKTPIASEVISNLRDIGDQLSEYRRATSSERMRILQLIESNLKQCFERLEKDVSMDSLKTPIYEDAYLNAKELQLSQPYFKPLIENLTLWQSLTPLLDSNYRLQSMIATRFVEVYGEGGDCKEPLDFITEIVPIMKKWGESLLPSVTAKELKDESEDILQLNKAKNEFVTYLLQKMNYSEDEVELTEEELEEFIVQIPESIQQRTVSQSYFCQWGTTNQEKDFLVINQMYHGYSMFFSRFLDQFPSEVTENIKAYIKDLFSPEEAVAEYTGTFGFNANLHPSLTDYDLNISSLPQGRKESKKVLFNDLGFKYDKSKHRVYLHHQDFGKINVLYLGFLMPFSLPLVMRALSQMFNSGNISSLFIMHKERNLSVEESLQIRRYPRIRIGQVILSRKKWIIPNNLLPIKDKGEDEFTYFLRINEWYKALQLPKKVFIRLIPMNEQEMSSDTSTDKSTIEEIDFTKFKPQYIDFEGPLFIKMFEKLIKDSSFGMVVEEMSPNIDEIPLQHNDESYVSEFLLELSQTYR